jgi:hypothetical protein
MPMFHVWSGADTFYARTVSGVSEEAVAKIFMGGQQASSAPPVKRPAKAPACRVQRDLGQGTAQPDQPSTPFWHTDDSEV